MTAPNEIPRSVPRRTTSGARGTAGAATVGAAAATADGAAGGGGALLGAAGEHPSARPTVLPAARRTNCRREWGRTKTGSDVLITNSPVAERVRKRPPRAVRRQSGRKVSLTANISR